MIFGKKKDLQNLQESLEKENPEEFKQKEEQKEEPKEKLKAPNELILDKEGRTDQQRKLQNFVTWFASLKRQQKRKMFPELRKKRVHACERCKTPYNNVAFSGANIYCNVCLEIIDKARNKRHRKNKHKRYMEKKKKRNK